MVTHTDRNRHLFIVRLWQEPGSPTEGSREAAPETEHKNWRGLVENVTTGQRLYFTSLADMSDFISFQLEKK